MSRMCLIVCHKCVTTGHDPSPVNFVIFAARWCHNRDIMDRPFCSTLVMQSSQFQPQFGLPCLFCVFSGLFLLWVVFIWSILINARRLRRRADFGILVVRDPLVEALDLWFSLLKLQREKPTFRRIVMTENKNVSNVPHCVSQVCHHRSRPLLGKFRHLCCPMVSQS